MTYQIAFSNQVEKTLKKWKKSSQVKFNKTVEIVNDMKEHPREGLGHPEMLVGTERKLWSRRVSASDRMIYEIKDELILVSVIELGGHYDDK